MKSKFGTRYTLWQERDEFNALGIEYYRLGKYAVELIDLDESLWSRRAIKQIITGEGALDDFVKTTNSSGEDLFYGSSEIDYLKFENGRGDDLISMGDGIDVFIGAPGSRNGVTLELGDGYFNFARTESGNDVIIGGEGMDFTSTQDGDDRFFGGAGHDHTYMGGGRDIAYLGDGNDWADSWRGDDWLFGGDGNDWLLGRMGNDTLYAGRGEDILEGGEDDDVLIFDSDAGVPTTLIGDFSIMDNKTGDWNDTAIGGEGRDVFIFQYEMDATQEVIERNLADNGRINWMSIMRENDNPHDHWVNWNGFDVIKDYEKGQDKIRLEGHTVDFKLHYIDSNRNGVDDTTLIEVYSNQALMIAGVLDVDVKDLPADIKMAHDRDSLGFIRVNNAILSRSDITIDTSITHAVDEYYFDHERSIASYFDHFDAMIEF